MASVTPRRHGDSGISISDRKYKLFCIIPIVAHFFRFESAIQKSQQWRHFYSPNVLPAKKLASAVWDEGGATVFNASSF